MLLGITRKVRTAFLDGCKSVTYSGLLQISFGTYALLLSRSTRAGAMRKGNTVNTPDRAVATRK